MTVHAGGRSHGHQCRTWKASTTPLPVPIALSDFKRGIYAIGAVPKTYDQMWVNQADKLTDAGLQFDFSWESGPTTSASMTATGSAALFDAVVGAEINFTAVLDVTIATPSTFYGLNMNLWLFDSVFAGFAYDHETIPVISDPTFNTNVAGSYDVFPGVVPVAGFNRMAFTLKSDRIIGSFNGSPALTRLVSVPAATALRLWFFAVTENDAPLTARLVCERAAFYAAQAAANLPLFSAA